MYEVFVGFYIMLKIDYYLFIIFEQIGKWVYFMYFNNVLSINNIYVKVCFKSYVYCLYLNIQK